jgi:hypothetical protein
LTEVNPETERRITIGKTNDHIKLVNASRASEPGTERMVLPGQKA